jgi:hypothetical protein
MQELSVQEIDLVNVGGMGFWEGVGWVADNPFQALGKSIDLISDAISAGDQLPPPPNLGFH